MIDMFTQRSRIAYFSMEIALRPEIHTYAGGLGILAGDTVRSCADLELPVVFVTLISREGYLRQSIDAEGRQVEQPDPWEPERWATSLGAKVAVTIEGRDVWVRPWLYRHKGTLGYEIPVLLLDTVLDENAPEDRDICRNLYGGDDAYRLNQEIVLGIGGYRLLRALGFDIETYHMNEGHSALLALELLHGHRRSNGGQSTVHPVYDPEIARQRCVFTTHTPVEAGHDRFPYDLVERKLAGTIDISALKAIAGPEGLNMTRLALNLSGYVNGVAKRHAEISQQLFPGYRVHAITNGVHVETWTCESFAQLYQDHFPNWRHEPEVLVRADGLDDAAVWEAHQRAKLDLLSRVSRETGTDLSPDVLTLGFARRMTGYKRLDLMFSNLDRLRALARDHPFQIVIAGKAHPRDEGGKRIIQALHRYKTELARRHPDRVPAQLRHGSGAAAHLRVRHLAQHAAAAAGGVRDQRHEGGIERRAEPGRARRLVDGGLHRRHHRLGHRRCEPRHGGRRRGRPLPQAGKRRAATVLQRSGTLDLDDEAVDQQDRQLLQQSADDAAVRFRGLPPLSSAMPANEDRK